MISGLFLPVTLPETNICWGLKKKKKKQNTASHYFLLETIVSSGKLKREQSNLVKPSNSNSCIAVYVSKVQFKMQQLSNDRN